MENKQKSEKIFKKYYLKYRKRIYWYVYRKISNTEAAEDITADVFLKLYENIDDVKDRGDNGILAWLYTVSRNQTIDVLRKKQRRQTRPMESEEIDRLGRVFDDFVDKAADEEQIAVLKSIIDVLDDVTQEVIQLRYEEDLKFSDIADIVGKSEGACKMMLYRGLAKVRDKLEEEGHL